MCSAGSSVVLNYHHCSIDGFFAVDLYAKLLALCR